MPPRSSAVLIDSPARSHRAEVVPAASIPADDRAKLKILIVDDEPTLRESCANILRLEGYNVTLCGHGREALDLLRHRPFDIALIDLYMSEVSGMQLVEACLEKNPQAFTIVMTGNPSVSSSVEALRAGAWDYLPKPFGANHLQVLVGRAAHAVLVARQSRVLRTELEQQHGHSDRVSVLGISASFRRAVELARKVAQTDASVFISGESGTGKELIAQFIHHHSQRSGKSLVAVNCAALPETLLESEMFGHCKGSFTGAIRDKPGLLEMADGSTFFLDEITEMSQAIQAKLLRVIQDGVVRRVGSTSTDAVVNVRFIAATNRDPEEAVEAGRLRQDLYYRLRVVPIHVPALRERPEDIPILAKHFLAHYWERHRRRGAPLPKLTDAATKALLSRPWPGNVRELQNVMEHVVVLLEPGSEIQPEDIPLITDGKAVPNVVPLSADMIYETYHVARDQLVGQFERMYLTCLVARARGNMSKAARMADVDRTTIYRLLEKHGLHKTGVSLQMTLPHETL